MKYLCEVDVIFNVKLIKGENGITLTQSRYVEKILSCLFLQVHDFFLPVIFAISPCLIHFDRHRPSWL
jgi:hypothetical protein